MISEPAAPATPSPPEHVEVIRRRRPPDDPLLEGPPIGSAMGVWRSEPRSHWTYDGYPSTLRAFPVGGAIHLGMASNGLALALVLSPDALADLARWAREAIEPRGLPIEHLELGVRAYNLLKEHGVATVDGLVEMSEADLRAIRGLGPKSLAEIKEALGAWSLALEPSMEY